MTTEDREKYVKLLGTKIENGRIMIRQIRGDAMKEIKDAYEEKEISEDEKFNLEKKLQVLTDEFVKRVEDVGKSKEEELLQV
jgi:ribosome recycling factor